MVQKPQRARLRHLALAQHDECELDALCVYELLLAGYFIDDAGCAVEDVFDKLLLVTAFDGVAFAVRGKQLQEDVDAVEGNEGGAVGVTGLE